MDTQVPGVVANAIVGSIGDGCLIRLLSRDEKVLTVVAIDHRDVALRDALGDRLHSQAVPRARAGWAAQALSTNVPFTLTGLAASQALTGTPAEVSPTLDGAVTSTVLAPLISEGRTVGVVQAFRGTGAAAYTMREQLIVAELAAGVRNAPAPAGADAVSPRALLEQSGNALWTSDLDGCTTYANTAAAGLIGVPASALTGTNMRRFLGRQWEGSPASLSAWPGPAEVQLTRADGETRWISIASAPLTDRAGHRRGTVHSAEDITARRLREASLRMALAAHQAVGELMDCARGERGAVSLMRKATAVVAEQLGAEFVTVSAVEGGDHVIPQTMVGWDRALVGRTVPFSVRSATSLCLDDDRPYEVTDYESLGGEVEMGELARQAQARSAITIGIGSGLGVMGVVSPRPNAFAGHDLSFLRTVSWLLASH